MLDSSIGVIYLLTQKLALSKVKVQPDGLEFIGNSEKYIPVPGVIF